MALSDSDSIPSSALNTSFDHYAENLFPAEYKLEAWCPTADLLALVSNENKLELFRLSWNQHWSVPIQGNVAASENATNVPRLGFGAFLQTLRAVRAGATTSTSGSARADAVSLVWRPDGNKGLNPSAIVVSLTTESSLLTTKASSVPSVP